MPDSETLDDRLRAVERAVSEGNASDDSGEATAPATRMDELSERIDELDERLDELDAAVQAVRGYVGAIRAERQASDDHRDCEQRDP